MGNYNDERSKYIQIIFSLAFILLTTLGGMYIYRGVKKDYAKGLEDNKREVYETSQDKIEIYKDNVNENLEYRVVVIDGCEYIKEYRGTTVVWASHKGNCKNH